MRFCPRLTDCFCPLACPLCSSHFLAGAHPVCLRPPSHHAHVCSLSEEKRRYRRCTPAPRRCPQACKWAVLAGRRAIAPPVGRKARACSMYKCQRYCGCMEATPASSASSGHVGMLGTRAAHELRQPYCHPSSLLAVPSVHVHARRTHNTKLKLQPQRTSTLTLTLTVARRTTIPT